VRNTRPMVPLALGENFNPSIAPFVGLMALGFVVGVAGHITKSSGLVLLGLLMIFVATVLLPLLVLGLGPS
jgi:hypothetical protein